MTLRDARPDDASALAALSIEVWLGTYIRRGVSAQFADFALETFTRAHFAHWMTQPNERFIVNQNEDGIDGFLRLTQGAPGPIPGCSDTEISTLYVQPRHQGHGIGRDLLQAGLGAALALGAPSVWLATNSENTPAAAFYQAQGFERIGRTYFRIGEEAYPNEVFRFAFPRH
ncbi:GNAT family N-acetyltransferase [Salipiger mangrovisoli]|uniref:GNAT family N-acetyltransferase n=1 Tax=Salipiger mangrovisoli TaxID=2865933 RepID=A0ABR9WVX1_9RHOB|nr:GNAT family N-acetyltransferase [Salipiger mangrovisoli]MBE9635435.1 GNAT family N-acetyltransferase [Salipiger mangrovisoli]